MRRTWIRLLAALAVWTAVFALCLGLGRRGLTLYFEIPPEATDVSLRIEPEGIVRQAENRISPDGSELTVSEGKTYVCIYTRNQGTFEYE